MATEPIQGLPYPDLTGQPPNVPADIKALADAVATRTVMRFSSTSARDAALPTPVDGMLCYVTADKTYYGRSDGQWVVLWSPATATSIPLAPDFSGSCTATQRGSLVEIAVNVSGAFPTGNTTIAAAGAVPAALRPTGNRRGPSAMNGYAASDLYVQSTGLIAVRNETGSARTGVVGQIIYLLG